MIRLYHHGKVTSSTPRLPVRILISFLPGRGLLACSSLAAVSPPERLVAPSLQHYCASLLLLRVLPSSPRETCQWLMSKGLGPLCALGRPAAAYCVAEPISAPAARLCSSAHPSSARQRQSCPGAPKLVPRSFSLLHPRLRANGVRSRDLISRAAGLQARGHTGPYTSTGPYSRCIIAAGTKSQDTATLEVPERRLETWSSSVLYSRAVAWRAHRRYQSSCLSCESHDCTGPTGSGKGWRPTSRGNL